MKFEELQKAYRNNIHKQHNNSLYIELPLQTSDSQNICKTYLAKLHKMVYPEFHKL